MITKTSFFLVGAIATVLLVSGMITEEASAFEPTKKEEKIMKKYVQATIKLEELCSGEFQNQLLCDELTERQMKYLYKMNEFGIFTADQEPDLRHLTETHDSTRKAAKAGIDPIEDEPPKENIEDNAKAGIDPIEDEMSEGNIANNSIAACSTCGDPKTMYVKSAYKDPYFSVWEIILYDHYSGVPSADIDTGSTSSGFVPIWTGLNQGITPYCYTASISLPATTSYNLAMFMTDYVGVSLVNSATTSESSYFVWYDPSDSKDYATQNNVVSGPSIQCTISSVSVS